MHTKRILQAISIVTAGYCPIAAICLYSGVDVPATRVVGILFDLPFARIGSSTVGTRQYYTELQAVKHLPVDNPLDATSPRERVWNKIVDEYALRELALQYKISATNDDLARYYEAFFGDSVAAPDRASVLQSEYGTTVAYFKQHILSTLLLRDRIRQYLITHEPTPELLHMKSFYEIVQGDPTRFEAETQSYYKDNGGAPTDTDILLSSSDITDDFAFVKKISVNGISPIVASSDGYRVYKLRNHFTDSATEAWQLTEFYIPVDLLSPLLVKERHDITIVQYAPLLINKKNATKVPSS